MFDIAIDHVRLGEQTIPIATRVDVLVCGGGVAGIAAAVAAAHVLNRHQQDRTGQPELLGPRGDGLCDSGTLSRS